MNSKSKEGAYPVGNRLIRKNQGYCPPIQNKKFNVKRTKQNEKLKKKRIWDADKDLNMKVLIKVYLL